MLHAVIFYLGTNKMKLISVVLITLFFSVLFTKNVWASKKQCQKYHDALLNIQSQQRAGYSLKEGERLAKKEKKARSTWWRCEQGKLPVKQASKKSTQASAKIALRGSDLRKNHFQGKAKSKLPSQNVQPFKTIQPIILKNHFSGDKQEQWLAFYKKPAQCIQPKDYKLFVWCVEHKSTKNKAFEQYYAAKALK